MSTSRQCIERCIMLVNELQSINHRIGGSETCELLNHLQTELEKLRIDNRRLEQAAVVNELIRLTALIASHLLLTLLERGVDAIF